MEQVRKRRRKHGRSYKRRKFWLRFTLYFFYFSAIFLTLYFLFDKQDMLREIRRQPDIFCWKVFGSALAFALGLAFWMRKDPTLTGK